MSILAQVDLTLALPPEAYAEQLPAQQAAVSQLVRAGLRAEAARGDRL